MGSFTADDIRHAQEVTLCGLHREVASQELNLSSSPPTARQSRAQLRRRSCALASRKPGIIPARPPPVL